MPSPIFVFPVDGDALFVGWGLETEEKRVDGPFSPDRGITETVAFALTDKSQGTWVEGGLFRYLSPGCGQGGRICRLDGARDRSKMLSEMREISCNLGRKKGMLLTDKSKPYHRVGTVQFWAVVGLHRRT